MKCSKIFSNFQKFSNFFHKIYNSGIANSSFLLMSLDELLDSLSFYEWKTITTTFVLPFTSFVGLILCSLSSITFFHRNFKDPVFFYYRLLSLVYILNLIHGIPYGLLYSPRYLTFINTNWSSMYLIYYICMSSFLLHFEGVLQIAILLTRTTIYSPWLKRHFTASPRLVSLILFLTCLCIDFPIAFSLKTQSFGTYFYIDSNDQKQTATYYNYQSSEFSTTPFGQILLGFALFFLNLFLTLIVGVVLNILSVYLYKSYLKEKNQREAELHAAVFTTNRVDIVVPRRKKLTPKELKEQKAENNMFYMAFTLSSMSILSRVLMMFCYVFYFFFTSFSNNLLIEIVFYSINTLVSSLSIFVFYFFNKMFRKEFKKKFLSKKPNRIENTSTLPIRNKQND